MKNDIYQTILIAIFTAIVAFFDNTLPFLAALLIGCTFNILFSYTAYYLSRVGLRTHTLFY